MILLRGKYLYILLLFIVSCNSNSDNKRFEVLGYVIGDTIDNGVKITEVCNTWISRGKLVDSSKVELLLFNNHIEDIIIDSISQKEFESLYNRITSIYNITPSYYRDSLYGGIRMKAEQYYWLDTISDDRISLSRSTKENTDSLFTLNFYNYRFSNVYREIFWEPEPEGEEIEICDIEKEE